jgi:protein-tyrosine phosphatase
MALTDLELGLPGRVYRSAMPFSAYDRGGRALAEFHEHGVATVVCLVPREECLRHAGEDLPARYVAEGFRLIHLPIADFGIPSVEDLVPAVHAALEETRGGHTLAIHCLAGRGRTGLFAACLARAGLGCSASDAIVLVRRALPGAVETPAQIALVHAF